MLTHLRRTLLMLTALLGVIGPPHRSPGRKPVQFKPAQSESPPAAGPATVRCPYRSCQGQGSRRKELVYKCGECNRVFYYCMNCKSPYPRGKEGEHEHKPPAA